MSARHAMSSEVGSRKYLKGHHFRTLPARLMQINRNSQRGAGNSLIYGHFLEWNRAEHVAIKTLLGTPQVPPNSGQGPPSPLPQTRSHYERVSSLMERVTGGGWGGCHWEFWIDLLGSTDRGPAGGAWLCGANGPPGRGPAASQGPACAGAAPRASRPRPDRAGHGRTWPDIGYAPVSTCARRTAPGDRTDDVIAPAGGRAPGPGVGSHYYCPHYLRGPPLLLGRREGGADAGRDPVRRPAGAAAGIVPGRRWKPRSQTSLRGDCDEDEKDQRRTRCSLCVIYLFLFYIFLYFFFVFFLSILSGETRNGNVGISDVTLWFCVSG